MQKLTIKINVMSIFKKLFFVATLFAATFAFSSCSDDEEENSISQTLEIGGTKYQNAIGFYHQMQGESEINIDIDVKISEENEIHGFGYFDESLIGKTVDLTTESMFNISFNYLEEDPVYHMNFTPQYKSGTLTIKKVSDGIHILLNSVNADDRAFNMDVLLVDEEEYMKQLK